MRTRWIVVMGGLVGLTVGGLLFLAYGSLAAPKQLRDLVYRRMTYAVIAQRIAADGSPRPQDVAKRLAEYVHTTVFPNVELPTQGNESFFLDNLVGGLGVCYHHSLGLATLAYHAGIDGRTRGMGGPALHSVTELQLDGQWRYLDAYVGLVFTGHTTGQIATVEQLKDERFVSPKWGRGDRIHTRRVSPAVSSRW